MSLDFHWEVARRLPLADAALRLLQWTTEEDFLAEVFQRHRGRSYEKSISFPLLVHLISDALLGHRGSAHQTFQQARHEHTLAATVDAAYKKLARVPLSLSLGFFSDAAERLGEVATKAGGAGTAPVAPASPVPSTLASYRVLGFDGKRLKYVAKRLKPLRGLKGNVLGGKLLVVQDLATGQAVAAHAVADGEAGDPPLVPPVLARVRSQKDARPRLWVGDRAFCIFDLMHQLGAAPDDFLVRYNAACGFHPHPQASPQTGVDDAQRAYRDELGWLGGPKHPRRIAVRKITVERPGQAPFVIVTSLQDRTRYPARDLLTLYRRRWGIETMFQQVVQTFELRHLIGSTPQATVFQAMLCLLLYNLTLVIRDYVAHGAQKPPREVSTKLLLDDLVRDLTGWLEVMGVDASLELLKATRKVRPEELRHHLEQTLGGLWTPRWQKAPTRPRPARRGPRAYICGGHTSVDKVLRGQHQEIPLRKQASPKNRANPPPFETPKDV